LLEAMAQGAPLVSTAKLGTRSILKAGCGALIVAEEIEPFAAAVVQVLQDRQLRVSLSEEGRRYAREWSSLCMARRLQELYCSLAPSAQARAPRHRASGEPLTDSAS
jgi:1,2-diacylglycerol 3-alpha-glucosyltransferase